MGPQAAALMQPMLKGVRVLDMSRVLAGPYCSMMLGDHGAEVIKVESVQGDDTRKWGPPFVGTESCYFLSVNRNKQSLAINYKTKEGLCILQRLANSSDVFLENFVPGVLEAAGLGFDQLRTTNPRLIYASLSGYGSTGPDRTRPGYDVIASAEAGLMSFTGEEGSDCPVKVGVAITDISAGMMLKSSIMTALYYREKTGKGQRIDTSLFEVQMASLANIASNYLNAGQLPQRWGTAHPSIVPYQAFRTRDGHLVVGAGNDTQFQSLWKVLDLKADPRFSTNQLRVQHRSDLLNIIQGRLKTESTDHWMARMRPCGFPCGPVNTLDRVFSHSQTKARDMVLEMEHPIGTVRTPGFPVKYSVGQQQVYCPPPTLGQDTRAILSALDVSQKDIERFIQEGIVGVPS